MTKASILSIPRILEYFVKQNQMSEEQKQQVIDASQQIDFKNMFFGQIAVSLALVSQKNLNDALNNLSKLMASAIKKNMEELFNTKVSLEIENYLKPY